MIRFLFLVLVFVVGLVAAAVYQGRLHHLELAFPGQLPAWTDRIAPDAGLRRGSMRVERGGVLPDLTLGWTARMPDLGGWHWRLRLTGDGVDLSADLTLAHWPDRGVVSNGTGTIDLARLAPVLSQVQGVLNLKSVEGSGTDLLQTPVFRGDLSGTLGGVRAQGADFGQGPVSGVLDTDGSWRIDLTLDGGVSPVTGEISGQGAQGLARVDFTVANGQDLPDVLRGVLSSIGQVAGGGWRVAADVPIF